MRYSTRLIAACLASTLAAGAAQAVTTTITYTDRVAFLAASGPATFEGFEGSGGGVASQSFGAFTVSESGGTSNKVYLDNFAGVTEGSQAANIEDNGASIFNIVFSSSIKSLGFDFVTNDDTIVTIGGATSMTLNLLAGIPTFFGITNADGFTTLTFDPSGAPSAIGVDALAYSGSLTSVVSPAPEPATWAMMIFGFGITGAAMRRKSTVATRVSYTT
jgi:hypothetical protein